MKFKLRKVLKTVFTLDTTRSGSKQQSALNVVWLDCGHIEEVVYWPSRHHYQPSDKCRCHSCPTGRPTMTPEEWKKEFLCAGLQMGKGPQNFRLNQFAGYEKGGNHSL